MSHATRWLLLACLALAPFAPALAAAPDPVELVDPLILIRKLARQLDEIDGRERTSNRRLVELEATVRELRAKLDRLEAKIEKVDATLEELRKDLAKVAARSGASKPGPAEPATPGTPTPAAEGPAAKIEGSNYSIDGDFITVTGTVANVSKRPLTFVTVEVAFVDRNGNVVKTESGYTNPRVLGPGTTATFKIVTRLDQRIRNHRLSVKTD